jgi:hypothetical protein
MQIDLFAVTKYFGCAAAFTGSWWILKTFWLGSYFFINAFLLGKYTREQLNITFKSLCFWQWIYKVSSKRLFTHYFQWRSDYTTFDRERLKNKARATLVSCISWNISKSWNILFLMNLVQTGEYIEFKFWCNTYDLNLCVIKHPQYIFNN